MQDADAYAQAVMAELDRAGRAPAAREPLARAIAAAVAAAPDFALAPARFAEHLAARLDPGAPALHVGELYLACACLHGCPAALARWQREQLAPLAQLLRSYPGVVVEEVLEALPARLLVGDGDKPPKLARYSGRSSLRTWLKTVAVNLANEAERRRRGVVPIEDDQRLVAALGIDVEQQLGRQLVADDFRAALAQALGRLAPEQRALLHGLFVEGLTLRALGAPEGVDPSTTFYRLKKIYAQLRADIERCLRDRLRISPSECDSLVRSMLSQLDLRLSGMLPR